MKNVLSVTIVSLLWVGGLLAADEELEQVTIMGTGTVELPEREGDWEAERRRSMISFVTLGYGDVVANSAFRSLHFRTECLGTSEIQDAIRVVKNYNAFSGDGVADALEEYRGRVECYQFGRASSPVVYVRFPYWTHQAEGSKLTRENGHRIPDSEFKALVSKMRRHFEKGLLADEFGHDEERTVYFWWD